MGGAAKVKTFETALELDHANLVQAKLPNPGLLLPRLELLPRGGAVAPKPLDLLPRMAAAAVAPTPRSLS